VLTNKPLGPSIGILESLGLRGFFTRIIGGDGPYPRKPDPAGLQSLMQGRTIMIGDSPADANVAQAAGCAFGFARYGFGAAKFSVAPTTPYVLNHARELTAVLDRFAADGPAD
jgi:phosphoglycolate phosphatase